MRKIAIFVEGMTEQELVIALVTELVGKRGLHVSVGYQFMGKVSIKPSTPQPNDEFYVLVVDCASDAQVKTQIRDNYASLVAAGFTAIIGLRDVYPLKRHDLQKIQQALPVGLPTGNVTPEIHLAVMEVEAWFIDETSHFVRIDPALTVQHIVANGFDLLNVSSDTWECPAQVLDGIYKLVNKRYLTQTGAKKKNRIQRTLRALSFDEMYINVRYKLPSFNLFVTSVESALF